MPSTVSSSRLGLAGLCILLAGQLLPMIDFSIVNVALDALAHSLGASETELELIVAVYGVAFAVCLAMGGRLGDNYGRRRLFVLGVALFAVASLLCGLAGSVWLLLVARALQASARRWSCRRFSPPCMSASAATRIPARWPPTAPSAAWPSSSARCSAASWSPPTSAASAGAACS